MNLPNDFELSSENPWPGPRSFTESSAAFFFGRLSEIEELHRLVESERLTLFSGQSGLGKTSLLQAGLFPRMRQGNLLPVLIRVDYGSKAAPLLTQIKGAISRSLSENRIDARPPADSESLWEYFHRHDVDFWDTQNRLSVVVLVFDQFEERFSLGRKNASLDSEANELMIQLSQLVENRLPPSVGTRLEADPKSLAGFDFDKRTCKVIFTLREDFLPELAGLRMQFPTLMENHLRLEGLTVDQAREVVIRPSRGLVSPDLGDQIVQFVVGKTPGGDGSRFVEPVLLSTVLYELNERRKKGGQSQITADLLCGSQEEILETFYKDAIKGLPDTARVLVEEGLVTSIGRRDSIAWENVHAAFGVDENSVATLINRHLLRREDRPTGSRIELVHDRLADVVARSREARRAETRQAQERAAAVERERTLKEREEKAQKKAEEERSARIRIQKKIQTTRLVALGCLLVAVLLFWQWRSLTVAQRREAESRRQAAEAFHLVLDLKARLQPFGQLDLLKDLTEKTKQFAFQAEESSDITELRAAVLRNEGELYLLEGDTINALKAFFACSNHLGRLAISSESSDPILFATAQCSIGIGKVFASRLSFRPCLTNYQKALFVLEGLTTKYPSNTLFLAELAGLSDRMGELWRERGYRSEAVPFFKRALASRQRIFQINPRSSDSARDLATSLDRLGSILAQTDSQAAKDAYEKAKSLRADELKKSGNSVQARLDYTRSLGKIGWWSTVRGDLKAAAELFGQCQEERLRLVSFDPRNVEWQQLLAEVDIALGDIFRDQENLPKAQAQYEAALKIYDELSSRDAKSKQWLQQRAQLLEQVGDLLGASRKLGSSTERQQLLQAYSYYQKARQLRDTLCQYDQNNLNWIQGRALSDGRFGDWYRTQRDWTNALWCYQASSASREFLLRSDPENLNWRQSVSIGYRKLGELFGEMGNLGQSEDYYSRYLAHAGELSAAHPDNVTYLIDAADAHWRVGRVWKDKFDKGLAAKEKALAHLSTAAELFHRLPEGSRAKNRIPEVELTLRSLLEQK